MQKSINIIILIILSCSIYGQYTPHRPYEKITFKNVDPMYYTTFHDKDFRELGSDGYNCFGDINAVKPLLYNNLYFTIHFNVLATSSNFGNYYITCMDLNDGIVKWQKKVFLEDVPNMEIPRILKINKNYDLEIIGQKKITQFENTQEFYDLILFKRTYSIATGSLKSLEHRPFDDNAAYHMRFVLFEVPLIFEENENKFRVVEKIDIEGNVGYKSFTLDETGALSSGPDTIKYAYFDDFVNGVNIAPVGHDSLLMIEIGFDQMSEAFIALKYLSYDLELIEEIKIKSPVTDNLPYIKLVDISPDNSKYLIQIAQFENLEFPQDHTLAMVLDKHGNVIKQMRLKSGYGPIYDWYHDDSIFYRYGSHIGINKVPLSSQNAVIFSTSIGDFQNTIEKEFIINDSLRVAFISRLFRYKNKEIVVFNEIAYKLEDFNYIRDYPAFATSIMAFNKGDFLPENVLTSSIETELLSIKTESKSFPNPSLGQFSLNIQGMTGDADVRIFDIAGHNVYIRHSVSNGETNMDLSSLVSGTYYYKICQGNKEITQGQWIKIK
jgi:hypothetical protein